VYFYFQSGQAPLGEGGGLWGVAGIKAAHEVPHVDFAPECGHFIIREGAGVGVGAIAGTSFKRR